MTSREAILNRLRGSRQPFSEAPSSPRDYLPVALVADTSRPALIARFMEEAKKLSSHVYHLTDPASACDQIAHIVGQEKHILNWSFAHIPLDGLESALAKAGITPAEPGDPNVRCGVTGVDAALAATGSLVYVSGEGRNRLASLLTPVHIAVVREEQILPNMEAWVSRQRENGLDTFKNHANTVIVSGPSRTADIAMEVILGVHGPAEIHIIIVP